MMQLLRNRRIFFWSRKVSLEHVLESFYDNLMLKLNHKIFKYISEFKSVEYEYLKTCWRLYSDHRLQFIHFIVWYFLDTDVEHWNNVYLLIINWALQPLCRKILWCTTVIMRGTILNIIEYHFYSCFILMRLTFVSDLFSNSKKIKSLYKEWSIKSLSLFRDIVHLDNRKTYLFRDDLETSQCSQPPNFPIATCFFVMIKLNIHLNRSEPAKLETPSNKITKYLYDRGTQSELLPF